MCFAMPLSSDLPDTNGVGPEHVTPEKRNDKKAIWDESDDPNENVLDPNYNYNTMSPVQRCESPFEAKEVHASPVNRSSKLETIKEDEILCEFEKHTPMSEEKANDAIRSRQKDKLIELIKEILNKVRRPIEEARRLRRKLIVKL